MKQCGASSVEKDDRLQMSCSPTDMALGPQRFRSASVDKEEAGLRQSHEPGGELWEAYISLIASKARSAVCHGLARQEEKPKHWRNR